MIRTFVIIVLGTVIIATVNASNDTPNDYNKTSDELVKISDDDNESNKSELSSTDIEEGRIRRHHFLPFYGGLLGLGGLGGFHTLAVLYAIKVKFVIVAAIIGLSIYYYSKLYKKACGETIIPYEGYSSHGPSEFTSYNGPDPYSAYSDIHSDITPFDLHHHAPGFDSSGPSNFDPSEHHHHHHSHDEEEYGGGDGAPDAGTYEDHPPPTFNGRETYSGNDDTVNSPPSAAPPTIQMAGASVSQSQSGGNVKIARQKRQVDDHININSINDIFERVNWGEIAFQFLGVDSDGCRRRFVCELDFRAKHNPFARLAFSLIGQTFFNRYRSLSAESKKPEKFSDCAKIHRDCPAAGAYDNNDGETTDNNDDDDDDDDNNEGDDEQELTTTAEIIMNDMDDISTELPIPNEIDTDGRRNFRHLSLGRLILRRDDSK